MGFQRFTIHMCWEVTIKKMQFLWGSTMENGGITADTGD